MNRLRRSKIAALVLALTFALVAASCGSDDNGSSSSDTTSTTAAAGDNGDNNDDADSPEQPSVLEIEHAQGTTEVPFKPQRVVVFDVGVIATLDALGVDTIIGVPTINSLPADLKKFEGGDYTKVGTLFEPDYEEVNALEPDLIIVAGRSAAVYPDLSKIAATVDLSVDNGDFLNSVRQRTETLGEIFGYEDEVAARLDAIDAEITELQDLAADAGTGLIVLTTGGEVTAYGPGSRFGIIHDAFGVTPAVEEVEEATHGDAVSFEFILEANPDILYVIDRDATIGEEGATAEQVLDNELVARTNAWKNGKVTYLDGFSWYIAPSGLTSIETMIADVRSSLE
ncbi:MAG: siderophore ABC transporter substrate-binding protein [Acidimicrobiia bacterium]